MYYKLQASPQKHVRLSPRPSTSSAPYPSPPYSSAIAAAQQNINNALHSGVAQNNLQHLSHSVPTSIIQRSPLSPNRRTRGENKKCRKVYGMDNKELWCTQCKWKKACSRFGD